MIRTSSLFLSAAFFCLAGVPAALAQSNPTNATETQSQGSSDISVTIPVLYRISGIDNLTLASYDGNGDERLNSPICIYTNNTTQTYRITLEGSNVCSGGSCPANDIFAIANDTNNQGINYTAYWNDEAGVGVGDRLQVGTSGGTVATTSVNQTGASGSLNCGGGNNANLSIDFTEANLLAVQTGTYTGTITITLIPPV